MYKYVLALLLHIPSVSLDVAPNINCEINEFMQRWGEGDGTAELIDGKARNDHLTTYAVH